MAIRDLISRRGIDSLYHFTTTINLSGIYQVEHIFPRSEYDTLRALANEDMYEDYLDHMDDLRLDGLNDHVNTSLSHPNVYLLNAYRQRKNLAHYTWCILQLDPQLMERDDTLYTVTNAASARSSQYGIGKGEEGLNQLFIPEVITKKGAFKRKGLPAKYPTDIQAEVLIPGNISVDHIKTIYFETESDLSSCAGAFRLMGLADGTRLFKVNKSVFSPSRY